MKTIGIIAEFNPFHLGHKYLIDKCKRDLGADKVVIVMSGDFVQRGAPAVMNKFSRATMALKSGADLVLELPVYYSLGSAEYFAEGAISVLEGLGCVDYLCFGSEFPDLHRLDLIADVLHSEPASYKKTLSDSLKAGLPFPSACSRALSAALGSDFASSDDFDYSHLFSSPNCILAIEYLKALKRRKSSITPYTLQRVGQPYHSLEAGIIPSASWIRERILSGTSIYVKNSAEVLLANTMPEDAIREVTSYCGLFLNSNDFSELIHYRLIMERDEGYTKYQDVSRDLSNKILKNLDSFESISGFCSSLKSKEIVYARISRCLMHIMLGITADHMSEYKKAGYTSYCRVLGFTESAVELMRVMKNSSKIPVITRPKDAGKISDPLQKRLFEETLRASTIYNMISSNEIVSEYSLQPVRL